MVWHYNFEGQVLAMIVVNLLVGSMNVDRRRIESNFSYRIEIYNELNLTLISCIFIGYAMCVGDGHARLLLGWYHIVFFLICLGISFSGFLYKGTIKTKLWCCLLYTSPSPRDRQKSRMPSSA